MADANNPIIKCSFNLYQTDLDAIREILARTSVATNMTQALRTSIATEHYIRLAVERGARIIIEEPDGRMKELVFR